MGVCTQPCLHESVGVLGIKPVMGRVTFSVQHSTVSKSLKAKIAFPCRASYDIPVRSVEDVNGPTRPCTH